MTQLAIFDLDGTLLDTLDDLANACNHALDVCGFPQHPRNAYKLFVGNGIHNLICRALSPIDDADSIRRVEAAFRLYYGEHAQDCTRPYPGIPELLDALRAEGIRVAVLTNKPHENAVPLVEQYFPEKVDLVLGQQEGRPIKPDPVAVEELLSHFGVSTDHCCYIGDSDVDMHTGKNAGVYTIGVSWGFRTTQELELAGADVIVHNCGQLLQKLIDKPQGFGYTKTQV